MAILVNMGKRGFVLKEGFVNPGEQIVVDSETAQKLTKAYPGELKEIVIKAEELKKVVEEPKAKTAVEPKAEPKDEEPVKKATRRKKGSK